jgi:heme-degrading monooxygenase HmoA
MTDMNFRTSIEFDPDMGYRCVIEWSNRNATSEWFKTEPEAVAKKDEIMAVIKKAVLATGGEISHTPLNGPWHMVK